MNLVFSGWPASGGSTLAMLTALLLDYKYLYAGGVFRFLSEGLYGSGDGDAQMQFERELGKEWDDIWEKYVQIKMSNATNLLLEGKTAGFMIDANSLFKIMIVANEETRAQRALGDGREEAVNTIKSRDTEVRQRWIDTLNTDIYDRSLIERVFNVIIDTSDMTVKEEIEIVIDAIRRSMKFEDVEQTKLVDKMGKLVKIFEAEGKLGLKQLLQMKKLIITPADILKEWNNIPELEIKSLNPKFQSLVMRYQDK